MKDIEYELEYHGVVIGGHENKLLVLKKQYDLFGLYVMDSSPRKKTRQLFYDEFHNKMYYINENTQEVSHSFDRWDPIHHIYPEFTVLLTTHNNKESSREEHLPSIYRMTAKIKKNDEDKKILSSLYQKERLRSVFSVKVDVKELFERAKFALSLLSFPFSKPILRYHSETQYRMQFKDQETKESIIIILDGEFQASLYEHVKKNSIVKMIKESEVSR